MSTRKSIPSEDPKTLLSDNEIEKAEKAVQLILARNLTIARERVGLTQVQLAHAARVSRSTIANIEAGEGDPQLSTLVALALALEIAPLLLLIGEKEMGAFKALAQESGWRELKRLTKDIAAELPPHDVEQMAVMARSGVPKKQIRAYELATRAAIAGLAASHSSQPWSATLLQGLKVGAALAFALDPTTASTALGAFMGKLFTQPAPSAQPRPKARKPRK